MSYVSLLKNIPEVLSQPTGIAAIASLGIHGAIALIVPLMPIDSSKSQQSASTKPVGILELSQADQNRLPQTPNSNQVALQPQLPQLPQQSQLPLQQSQLPLQQSQLPLQQSVPPNLDAQSIVLPPSPPAYMQPISPPIVTNPNDYRISSSSPRRSLQQVPRNDLGFDTSGFNAANKKFTTPISNFSEKELALGESKPLPVDPLPKVSPARIPNDLLNAQPPSPSVAPPITAANSNITRQTTPVSNDTYKVAQNRSQVAPIGEIPKAGDNLTLASESISRQSGVTPKMPNLPTQATQQTIVAQVNSYENLRKAVQREYPHSQEKAVIRDTISTDKPGIEGTVLGYLVVDPEGKVLDIKFQDKSITPDLQLKAREYFNAKAPKGDKQTNRYPFSLRFQNNDNNSAEATQEQKPAVVIPKPLSTSVNGNQPTSTPATSVKPLPALRIRNEQPAPAPITNVKPLPTPAANNTQQPLSVEPSQKLIQKLNEVRQQRQNSNPEK
ncbi:hypothetical protein I8752_06070 [Nostocaceae cyanobacterium CENA369]|uniref:TonB C-terminal domain-containing protein n=1 Tax=Dendronalium phyllosphericum CENA369 TaxID=1725256 RepID=A0A8J7I350_9NOST|nr:hypothetical protein [Dendronalium phyllosphericum]MBH8572585.1 hypothetical protein [Dendronalium phyllosphericum CENA369]